MDAPSLSPTDKLLVVLLQGNARRTNKDLAQEAGIAESTCLERIRSLQQRGIIRGWHAEVDPAALGRTVRALISVRLQPKTAASVKGFQHDMLEAPETVSVNTVTGADDFVVEVAVPSVDRLRTFVLDVITSRSDVADTRTALVYEHVRKPVLAILEP
ncbi:MAG: putative transcriptional regulator, AsnC family [Acidimicrobiia bacterium]|nr:putative transcriptional regulator, AsnC family [Acidimicrobiia bacterium]